MLFIFHASMMETLWVEKHTYVDHMYKKRRHIKCQEGYDSLLTETVTKHLNLTILLNEKSSNVQSDVHQATLEYQCQHVSKPDPGPHCSSNQRKTPLHLPSSHTCYISTNMSQSVPHLGISKQTYLRCAGYRVPKCDVIKFSFLHYSTFMTIFQ